MCALTVTTGDPDRASQLSASPPAAELASRTADSPSETSTADRGWPIERWVTILDRIDYRQLNVGLRYWGPPLWLEVTMTGPDADSWPATTDHTLSWDWQSSTPCPRVDDLLAGGADDDSLVAAVGRYTIENLILNAVHEIGEWFRFDGRRVFPAHIGGLIGPGERDPQGNGAVELRVTFDPPADAQRTGGSVETTLDERARERAGGRLTTTAAASLFTCLPGTTISFEAAGPAVRTGAAGAATTMWRSEWSTSTIDAANAGVHDVMPSVARDVHRALVLDETERICRAFHIDGLRRWHLAGPRPPLGAEPPDTEAVGTHALCVSTRYAATPEGSTTREVGEQVEGDSPIG